MDSRISALALCSALVVTTTAPVAAQNANVQYSFSVDTANPIASSLPRPIGVVHAGDGSGRLFIVLQGGEIRIWNGSQVLPTPFFTRSVLLGDEQGLLGLAFHPSYETNGFFYVHYTNANGDTAVSRYQVSTGNPNLADLGSELPLFTEFQPESNHNGGQMAFGPDGYLYIAIGDGGGAGDDHPPIGNGQNLNTRLGKILRIDVNGGPPYAVPANNPFVGQANVEDEIWAWGLRNPWRFSFDRQTGDLFIGDVGQGSWEEVDFQANGFAGGQNYGWRRMEGAHCFNPGSGCDTGSLVYPILEYSHSLGCSITGGYRLRKLGDRADGEYYYADYCSGRIWASNRYCGGNWRTLQVADMTFNVPSFGEGEDGSLYVVRAGITTGAVYRVVTTPIATNTIFSSGFEQTDLRDWNDCVNVQGIPAPGPFR